MSDEIKIIETNISTGSERGLAKGFLYCLTSKWMPENTFKLGFTVNLDTRLRNYKTSHLEASFKLVCPPCENPQKPYCPKTNKPLIEMDLIGYREQALFKMLAQYRVLPNAEFFNCSISIVENAFNAIRAMSDLHLIAYIENFNIHENVQELHSTISDLKSQNLTLNQQIVTLQRKILDLETSLKSTSTELKEMRVSNSKRMQSVTIRNLIDQVKTLTEQNKTLRLECERSSDLSKESSSVPSARELCSPFELSSEGTEVAKNIENKIDQLLSSSSSSSSSSFCNSLSTVETFNFVNPLITFLDCNSSDKAEKDEKDEKVKVEEEETEDEEVKEIDLVYDPLKCMARIHTSYHPYQCKDKRMVNSDYCKGHALDASLCSTPCQFDDNGNKFGLFCGRVDQDYPMFASNGEIAIKWLSPPQAKRRYEEARIKGVKEHKFSDMEKKRQACRNRKQKRKESNNDHDGGELNENKKARTS